MLQISKNAATHMWEFLHVVFATLQAHVPAWLHACTNVQTSTCTCRNSYVPTWKGALAACRVGLRTLHVLQISMKSGELKICLSGHFQSLFRMDYIFYIQLLALARSRFSLIWSLQQVPYLHTPVVNPCRQMPTCTQTFSCTTRDPYT